MSDDFVLICEKGPVDLREGTLKELQAAWVGLKRTYTSHSQNYSEAGFKVHPKEAPAFIAKLETSLNNLRALVNCFQHQTFDLPSEILSLIRQYENWIINMKMELQGVRIIPEEPDESSLVTMKDLREIIEILLQDRKKPTEADSRYDYGPRSRFHLVELEKFEGKIEEYPTFRQNLALCLERERFKDEKDKALFILRHLAGSARDCVLHFTQPLTSESYATMLSKLDKTYGEANQSVWIDLS